MSWFDTIKTDKTKQGKLPKELVEGASVATKPVEEWFKGKGKKTKPKDNTDGTTQTALDEFEE